MARHHIRSFGQKGKRLARNIDHNPVANAVAMAQGKARIAEYQRSISIAVYMAQPGEDATHILAKLGWLLGLAAESERSAAGITQRLRVLHGGVRAVQQACLQGYAWPNVDMITAMDSCIQQAVQALTDHPTHALAMMIGADHFEHLIHTHAVTADTITGAELYREVAA